MRGKTIKKIGQQVEIRSRAKLRKLAMGIARKPKVAGRMGRPPKYRIDMARQAEVLCKRGFTDAEIAQVLGVAIWTMQKWRSKHQEFGAALKRGKELADDLVERKLFERAVGYVQPAVKIFMPAGFDEPVYAPYEEHIPPDVGAQTIWLKNRRGKEWRERPDLERAEDDTLSPEQKAEREQAYKNLLKLVEDNALKGGPPLFPRKALPAALQPQTVKEDKL